MEVDKCPPVVNITSISTEVVEEPWNSKSFPFINHKHYLQDLAKYAGKTTFKHAMVVIGPKDAGKSTGLSQMTNLWKRIGHTIIDLNLKGLYEVNGDIAMRKISTQLKEQLSLLDVSSYGEIYDCTRKHCFTEKPLGMVEIITSIAKSVYPIIIAMLSAFGGMQFLKHYFQEVNFLKFLWYLGAVIGGILLTFCVGLLIFWKLFPYAIYERVQPLDQNLRHGDWTTLICYLNCVSKAKPGNRPILIIREIINFQANVLEETLKALEHYKENRVSFPAVLETSGFLWFRAPGVRKSRSSYWPYVIKEMDYEEGKHELVIKLKIFTLKEYKKIYDVIGGHVGSYATMWEFLNHYDMDLNKALDILIQHATMHLLSCMKDYPNKTEIVTLLKNLKENGYIYNLTVSFDSGDIEDLSQPLEYLIQCNILFYDGATVIPQKKIIKDLISGLIK